jgi:ribosomal protein S17E
MGKAVSNNIKAKARIVITEFKGKLGTDFRKNKDFLKKMELPLSKLTVNLMAGYITKVLKKEAKDNEKLTIKTEPSKVPIKAVESRKITRE